MKLLKTNLLMTMIALCFSVTVNAQIVIHGTVTDTEGPLMGATVAVKGSTGTLLVLLPIWMANTP